MPSAAVRSTEGRGRVRRRQRARIGPVAVNIGLLKYCFHPRDIIAWLGCTMHCIAVTSAPYIRTMVVRGEDYNSIRVWRIG